MEKLLAHTKPTVGYRHTFLCKCETTLYVPDLKPGQIVWCPRCDQHWRKCKGPSFEQIKKPK